MIGERRENEPRPPASLFAASLRREKQPYQAAALRQIHSEQFRAARLVILQRMLSLGRHPGEQLVESEAPARLRDHDVSVGEALDTDARAFAEAGAGGDLTWNPDSEAVAPFA